MNITIYVCACTYIQYMCKSIEHLNRNFYTKTCNGGGRKMFGCEKRGFYVSSSLTSSELSGLAFGVEWFMYTIKTY